MLAPPAYRPAALMFAFAWLVAPCYTALLRGAPNGRRGCGLPPCMQSHEPVHDAMFRPAKVAPAGIQHMADKICLVSTDAADAAPYLGIYRKGVFGHSGKNKYQRHGYYEQVGDPNKIVWWDGEGGVWTVGWRTVGGRHYAVDSLVSGPCRCSIPLLTCGSCRLGRHLVRRGRVCRGRGGGVGGRRPGLPAGPDAS